MNQRIHGAVELLDTSGIWRGANAARQAGAEAMQKHLIPDLASLKTDLHKVIEKIGQMENAQSKGLELPATIKFLDSQEMKNQLTSAVGRGELPAIMIDENGLLKSESKQDIELLCTAMQLSRESVNFAEKFTTALFNSVIAKNNSLPRLGNVRSTDFTGRFEFHPYDIKSSQEIFGTFGSLANLYTGNYQRKQGNQNEWTLRTSQLFSALYDKKSPDTHKFNQSSMDDIRNNTGAYILSLVEELRPIEKHAAGLANFINNLANINCTAQVAPSKAA